MRIPRLLAALAAVVLAACAEPPPAAPIVVQPPPATLVMVAPPTAAASASAPPAASTRADDPPPGTIAPKRIPLELRSGEPPCTLVFDAGMFEDHPDWFLVSSVSRIATEAGGSCAAGVLFDLATQKKAHPDDMDPEPLLAGPVQKPGRPKAKEMEDGPNWNKVTDLDFDGWTDLCFVVMTGAYNYSQMCWLFDPAKRTFRRAGELDEIIFMTVDPVKKRISNSHRLGGPMYATGEWAWDKGKLVKTFEEITTLGEKPNGSPLPAGYSRWVVRSERRGGRLMKVKEGPERDAP